MVFSPEKAGVGGSTPLPGHHKIKFFNCLPSIVNLLDPIGIVLKD